MMPSIGLPSYNNHPSVILGSVGVLSFLVERCNLNLQGSVVPSGDMVECLRFSSVVHHARIFWHTVESFMDANLKHAAWERAREILTLLLCLPPLLSASLLFLSVCLCPGSCLSLYLPPVALPTHPLLPPPPSTPTLKLSSLFFSFTPLRLTNWLHTADHKIYVFPLS